MLSSVYSNINKVTILSSADSNVDSQYGLYNMVNMVCIGETEHLFSLGTGYGPITPKPPVPRENRLPCFPL